jgi:DNA-binding sugar fermentation-stimulating protein
MNNLNEFEKIVSDMKDDFEKFFDKENNAAGTRVRKHLQALATLCKEGRKSVTDIKTARKEAKS